MSDLRENKMGTMKEGPLLLSISLPMMISMIVQALYNIVDSYFVAKISNDAFSAVSLAFPLQTLMIAIAAGTGVGVNALISRSLGEKNSKMANDVAMNGIFIYFLSYIVVALMGLLLVRPFYVMQTKNEYPALVELGCQYLQVVMIASFGLFGQFTFERLLQSTGKTIYTMISQGVGAIINIILDPLMIFGIGFFPEMGIAGAAVATVIGQCIAAILAFIFNHTVNKELTLSVKGFRPNGKIIGKIYAIGFPSIVMQSIGSVMVTGMNRILMGLADGPILTSIFGLYFKLQSFFFMPIFGLNNGMIPILAFNYGAKQRKRIINTLRWGMIIAFGLAMVGFLGFELIPDKLIMPFDKENVLLAAGVPALRIIGIHYLIAWFCIVAGSLFQSVGKAYFSMIVSFCRQLVILLPAAYILAKIGGADLIWWSFPIAEIASFIVTFIFFQIIMKKTISEKTFAANV